jgi:hypothetical protein
VKTACSMGGKTSCNEGCVVVKGAGGANREIAREGVCPQNLDIEARELDLG